MNRIIYVPIEPLTERYSAQYLEWFPREFKKAGIECLTIAPRTIYDKIRDGSFLDVCGTNYYKAVQIKSLCEMAFHGEITDDDVIFLGDMWMPGLESISYIRDALKIKFKIVGMLYAGTYDPYDFLTKNGMGHWGKPLEESWFKIVDKIFMATNFHKRLVMQTREIDPKKLVVTGHPICLDWDDEECEKENIVVFPHRLDSEKNPDMFDMLEDHIQRNLGDHNWLFYKTKEVTKTKQEYYNLLRRAKISVSFADQETYGFAMVESIMSGCLPIVPDRLSYTEMYNPVFTYSSFNEAVSLCKFMMTVPSFYNRLKKDALINQAQLIRAAQQAIPNMIKECQCL